MRFSTVQIHRQSIEGILQQQSSMSKTQQQISLGKRIVNPSDDPLSTSKLLLLKENIAKTESYDANADAGEGQLQLAEGVLDNVTNALHRIRELQIRAGNSILNKDDRDSIIREIETLREELVGSGNAKDGNGDYLFAGSKTGGQPFTQSTPGVYTYNGDAAQRYIQIDSGLQIPISDSGFEVFTNIPKGNGTFVISDPGAANTGSGIILPGSVIDRNAYVPDTYTITFVTNSAGDLAYQVVGASSGQLIPALPAVTPASAPAYTSGQNITFNGIEVSISGTPVAGDNFQIDPSPRQNLFNTVSDIITALRLPVGTESERATASNQLNQSFAALDQGFAHILSVRASIGTRLNEIDNSREVNSNFTLQIKSVVSSIEDLDYAEAITSLQLQQISLEAAQQSYVQTQGLSLFRFLS